MFLQALPCCGLCRAATGYALQRSLSVVPGCPGNGRLRQQWVCTSVGVIASAMVDAPPPRSCTILGSAVPSGNLSPGVFRIAILFVPLRYPKCCHPEISWASSLSKSCSVSSSALPSLKLLAQQGTQMSVLCGDRCVAPPQRGPLPHRPPAAPAKTSAWRSVSPLYLGISPFCGQQRSVWKCGPDSPPLCIDHELQSPVVLTALS